MSYTIAVPSSSIQKVLNYGLPSITSVSGGVAVANGSVTITSLYPNLPIVVDAAYQQANVATGIATSSYNQANTATTLAQIVYDYANTIQGGAAVDNVARQISLSAQANTIILQGVNVTQNTRLNGIEGVDATQNTRINSIETINNNQNTNITIIQAVDVTQNTRLSSIETINTNQNTSITVIQGVDLTQNTNITAVNNYAAGAFAAANSALSLISGGGVSAIDSVARETANGANGLAQGAFNVANNKVSSITGTVNQITVAGTTTIPELSLPQNINTGAFVEFGSFGVGTAASGVSGEIRATDNITAYYSDDRLKKRLGIIDNALQKVNTLTGFYYEANETAQSLGYKPKREVGLSAQEVQNILPEIVVPAPIDEQYLTIYYEKLIPLLVEAIKELTEKVEKLEKNTKT
jgi:hypothetical protein